MKKIACFILWVVSLNANGQTFTIDTISDAVFLRMQGKSYKNNCTVDRSELRYLRLSHYDENGEEHIGEIVCNKKISNDLKEIFQELYKQKYPIERMRLIDEYEADDERSMQANNTSCFNYRTIAGSQKLSKHSAAREPVQRKPLSGIREHWIRPSRRKSRLPSSPQRHSALPTIHNGPIPGLPHRTAT